MTSQERTPSRELELTVLAPPSSQQQTSLHVAAMDAALDMSEDRANTAERSRKRAWLLASLLVIVCAAQAAAIAIMLPLKEIVPYTILVDRSTGYTETVRGIHVSDLNDDEALVHSFLAQYVLQRETIDPADFESRYERIALWSADDARESYLALYRAGSPTSVLNDVRAGEIVSATIKSIELVDPTTARVRFLLNRQRANAPPVASEHQSLITYRFTGAPMRMQDRLINPLGFQVVHYRRDVDGAPSAVATLAHAKTTAAEPVGSTTGPQESEMRNVSQTGAREVEGPGL